MTAARGFAGRGRELQVLAGCLSRARAGTLALALVEGDAGIGKTRLVEEFLRANSVEGVVVASGAEPEAGVAFALADQLVRSGGAGGLLDGGVDDVSAALRLLEHLRAGPAVVVIDDAQWADPESIRALVFALRRLPGAGLLVVLIARTDEREPLPESLGKITGAVGLRIGALGERELCALAGGAGVTLSAFAARRLCEHTCGNPLHVLSLLRERPAGAWEDPLSELGAPRVFAARVARRVAALEAPARELVRVAAVLGPGAPPAALAPGEGATDALDAAIAAGLLQASGHPPLVSFTHPLIRTVVYGGLGPGHRARLHLAAAGVVERADDRLRHRAAAAMAPDEGLAEELETCALRQADLRRWPEVHALSLAASRLSPLPGDRERRFWMAADALLSAGEATAFDALRDRTSALPAGPRRDFVEAHRAALDGDRRRAAALLGRAWDHRDEAGAELTAAIAHRLAVHCARQLRGEEALAWARRAAALADPTAGVPLAMGLALTGRANEARAELDERAPRDPEFQALRGRLRLLDDDIGGALADLRRAARGPGNPMAWLSGAEHAAGLWDDADRHARQAGACEAALLLAIDRGRLEAAAAVADALSARAAASEFDTIVAAEATARVAAARGQWPEVAGALSDFASRPPGDPVNEPGLFGWIDIYASGLLGQGLAREAAAFLEGHEQRATERGRRSVLVRLARQRARCEAALGQLAPAIETLAAAVERAGPLGMPYELALTRLAFGQLLRRAGRRRAAVEQLGAARRVLAELGARPALQRCDRELVASGLEPVKRSTRDDSRLTPQEDAVAALAGAGLTNREIAAELMLSVKTIEVHLTRIYAKLGIASRTQLREPGMRQAAT